MDLMSILVSLSLFAAVFMAEEFNVRIELCVLIMIQIYIQPQLLYSTNEQLVTDAEYQVENSNQPELIFYPHHPINTAFFTPEKIHSGRQLGNINHIITIGNHQFTNESP
jgi:hypothetical protein